jgi:hydroxyacylglutathione hydrolase
MFMRMIYDEKLAQAAYLIGCQRTGEAILIDPQRDIDRYLTLAKANGLKITAVAETHIHADFLSGARELAEQIGAKVYVSGEGGDEWGSEWLDKKSGGGPYLHQLLHDGDRFTIGHIDFKVMHTPGHTPEHISFLVTDRGGGANEPIGMITGDFLFVGDLGRPDLLEKAAGHSGAMEPAARRLFSTVSRLSSLPEFVQVWPAHGAGSACGKALGAVPTSTVGYERRFNPAIAAAASEQQFVSFILSGQPEPPLYFADMKRLNKIGPPLLGRLPQPPRIGVEDLRRLDTKSVALIDTRTWEAFRRGHVPGALYLPLNASFNTDAGSFIGGDEDIYLILEAHQLEEAVRDLVRIGLDRIRGWYPASELPQYESGDSRLATVREITVAEADQLLANSAANVLDVRRATEFVAGHLPAAVNIAHTRLAARLDEIPAGKPLLINCLGGGRSARACAFLQRRGVDVMNLKGGMQAWEQSHQTANV